MAAVIVANGAFKSGSTWIYKIVNDLCRAVAPPQHWLRENWANPSVHPDRLEEFLSWAAATSGPPICFKAHYNAEAQADVLESSGAQVVDIQRDLRDVLVSAYFHYSRQGDDVGDTVDEFYRQQGSRIISGVVRYHNLWDSRPNTFLASYEELQQDPVQEIGRLAGWLGLRSSEYDVEQVIERHDFRKLQSWEREAKSSSEGLFYRKGETGDWRNHLDPALAEEVGALNAKLPRELSSLVEDSSSR